MKYLLIVALLLGAGTALNAPMRHVVIDQALPKIGAVAHEGFTRLQKTEVVQHATAAVLQWTTAKVQLLLQP